MDGVKVTELVLVFTSLVGIGETLGLCDTETDEVPE